MASTRGRLASDELQAPRQRLPVAVMGAFQFQGAITLVRARDEPLGKGLVGLIRQRIAFNQLHSKLARAAAQKLPRRQLLKRRLETLQGKLQQRPGAAQDAVALQGYGGAQKIFMAGRDVGGVSAEEPRREEIRDGDVDR